MRPTPAMARALALAGHGLLMATLLIWHGWLAPPEILPRALVLAVLAIPLLCATPGLWRGRRYTHAWSSLLALLYFVLGVDGMAAGTEPAWLAPAVVTASMALFVGTIAYVRMTTDAGKRDADAGSDSDQDS